jgi:RNA polymerase sigma factor (sigma-70 family)
MAFGEAFDGILAAAQAGAEWAVARIYRDLDPAVRRYLRVQGTRELEDVASETWMAVARGLRRFHGDEADLRRWVFTIARRRLIDARRRDGRRQECPIGAAEDARAGGDVEEEALEALSTERVRSILAVLPPDQADVLLLRVIAGLDAANVARIMGKRAGTVRVLQHRALARLAARLSEEELRSRKRGSAGGVTAQDPAAIYGVS